MKYQLDIAPRVNKEVAAIFVSGEEAGQRIGCPIYESIE